jgi:hypothetical protein
MQCVVVFVGCNKVQPLVHDQIVIPTEVVESIQSYKEKLVDDFDNNEGSTEDELKKIEDFDLPKSLTKVIADAKAELVYEDEMILDPSLTDDTPEDTFCLQLKIKDKEFVRSKFALCSCFGYIYIIQKREDQTIEDVYDSIIVF